MIIFLINNNKIITFFYIYSLSELTKLEYRKIKVKGRFDHENELYLGPRSLISKGESASEGGLISAGGKKTAGHLVITPFILSNSG